MSTRVSIVIPTTGSRESLGETVESLSELEYFGEFDVIVVSDKETSLSNFISKDLRVIVHGGKPGLKRNIAAMLSNSEILAFIDDDVIVTKNWLRNIVRFFENNENVCVVGGPNLTPSNSSIKERASGYILSSFLGTATMSARYSLKEYSGICDERYLMSCNLAIKRKALLEIGGFPEDLFPGEETILLYRLRDMGYNIYYDPNIVVYHYRRPLFIPHMKQLFSYGKSKGIMIKMFGLNIGLLSFLPLLLVCYLILTPIIAVLLNSVNLLLVYGLSILAGFVL